MRPEAGNPEANAIQRDLVETTGEALLMRDFDLYMSCFHLPMIISTWDTAKAFETPRDMRRVFDGILANIDTLDVIRLERTCIGADFIGPNKIEGIYETQLYDKFGLAAPPALIHSIIERHGNRWQFSVSRYEVAGTPLLKYAFGSGRDLTQDEAAGLGWDG